MTDYRAKRRAAQRVIRDRHREEYEALLKEAHAAAKPSTAWSVRQSAALTRLTNAHADEYRTLMGPLKQRDKARFILNDEGVLVPSGN
jgi:hypothetical protein